MLVLLECLFFFFFSLFPPSPPPSWGVSEAFLSFNWPHSLEIICSSLCKDIERLRWHQMTNCLSVMTSLYHGGVSALNLPLNHLNDATVWHQPISPVPDQLHYVFPFASVQWTFINTMQWQVNSWRGLLWEINQWLHYMILMISHGTLNVSLSLDLFRFIMIEIFIFLLLFFSLFPCFFIHFFLLLFLSPLC